MKKDFDDFLAKFLSGRKPRVIVLVGENDSFGIHIYPEGKEARETEEVLEIARNLLVVKKYFGKPHPLLEDEAAVETGDIRTLYLGLKKFYPGAVQAGKYCGSLEAIHI